MSHNKNIRYSLFLKSEAEERLFFLLWIISFSIPLKKKKGKGRLICFIKRTCIWITQQPTNRYLNGNIRNLTLNSTFIGVTLCSLSLSLSLSLSVVIEFATSKFYSQFSTDEILSLGKEFRSRRVLLKIGQRH